VSTIIGSRAMCTGERKSSTTSQMDIRENVTDLLREKLGGKKKGTHGGIFGRQLQWRGEYRVGNNRGEGSTAWGIKARKGVQLGDEEYSREEYNSPETGAAVTARAQLDKSSASRKGNGLEARKMSTAGRGKGCGESVRREGV